MNDYRIERDSMGEVKVPKNAYYGAQTQRAIDNFPVSGIRFSRSFIEALGLIKKTAARVNEDLGLLDKEIAGAIRKAAQEVIDGKLDEHFAIDIFQTGSGTSTNMNANEVIANRANEILGEEKIHPNDHVNFGQSSNDTIPTAIRIAAVKAVKENLVPALEQLEQAFIDKGKSFSEVVKTGRTHLMDAMPVTIEQEFSGYARQAGLAVERLESVLERLSELPQGGTAVGTGLNTDPEFGEKFARAVSKELDHDYREVYGGCTRGTERPAENNRCRPDEDRERPALDEFGSQQRDSGDRVGSTPARFIDHARESKSGDRGVTYHGLRPGDRQ